jgi:hypothetical protein
VNEQDYSLSCLGTGLELVRFLSLLRQQQRQQPPTTNRTDSNSTKPFFEGLCAGPKDTSTWKIGDVRSSYDGTFRTYEPYRSYRIVALIPSQPNCSSTASPEYHHCSVVGRQEHSKAVASPTRIGAAAAAGGQCSFAAATRYGAC